MEAGFSILNMGYLNLPKSILFLGESEDRVKVPVVSLLVKKRDLTIIFDLGYDSRKKYRQPPRGQLIQTEANFLPNQLKRLGLDVKSIDLVVASHLHFDHAGFLSEFRNTGIPILIQQTELNNAYWPGWIERVAGAFKREDSDYPDLEYSTINGDYHLDDGLDIITFPGHTPGLHGLFVETDNRTRILAVSDAIYTLANFGPPKRAQGLGWNVDAWAESVEKMRLISKIRRAEIYPGHDQEFYSKKNYAPHVYK